MSKSGKQKRQEAIDALREIAEYVSQNPEVLKAHPELFLLDNLIGALEDLDRGIVHPAFIPNKNSA